MLRVSAAAASACFSGGCCVGVSRGSLTEEGVNVFILSDVRVFNELRVFFCASVRCDAFKAASISVNRVVNARCSAGEEGCLVRVCSFFFKSVIRSLVV